MDIEEIKLARRDLERRLAIDIAQFEKDTGLAVTDVKFVRVAQYGKASELVSTEVNTEIPR